MRRKWDISYYSGSGLWIEDGSIPRSGGSINDNFSTNAITLNLANGDIARSTPENASSPGKFSLSWPRAMVTSNMRNKLKALHGSGAGIRISTHVNGVTLEGYIDNVEDVWTLTGDPQEYEFNITFQSMNVE